MTLSHPAHPFDPAHASPEGLALALDLGTGSVKVGLVTAGGELVRQASRAYPALSVHPGWAETDPAAWWAGVVGAVQEVLEGLDPARVQALGLSGQMHGVVLVDAGGQSLRPAVLWSDTRSAAELASFSALDPSLLARLGNPPVAGMAGPTLLWLRQHEPAHYQTARWALQPKDWLRLYLTGEVATDPSDASGTLLYDLTAQAWSGEILEKLGLNPALLPPVLPSNAVAGTLLAPVAAELGLLTGIPIVTGAADTAAALYGSGLLPGEAQLTVGTGAQVVVRAAMLPAAHSSLHVFREAEGAGCYTLAAIQNAGLVLEWARRTLRLTWPEFYAAAQEIDADPLPTFLPYLTGDRTPHLDPHARAAWVGLNAAHDHRHMARAAFEGVALSIAQAAELLPLLPGQALLLAGGGTVDPWWRQLLADCLGRELRAVATPGASVLGAARLAWAGIGVERPPTRPQVTAVIVPQVGRISAERHRAFRAAYRAV
ncbi:xylulokinase [Deinococcus sp. QL22]|uniref:xylulokinase n=1 Tax=Deinococcus sp. QL22 TaxID=2939437 RepID=UPI00201815F4|nr:FGGY family carbohydrate kinase [Deinococcus sp. QL22]UQN07651.1 FGGY family carbohydrate kinase [Deinococcus sp. QL22]